MPLDSFQVDVETRRFARWTDAMVSGVERDLLPAALRKVAFDFLARVIQKTPVDTGRARAGWTAWLDAQGRPINIGGRNPQAVQEGKAASRFQENLRGSEQHITVVNGVRYILLLEFGRSPQAPAGMVRITIRELQAGRRVEALWVGELDDLIRKADRRAGF